MFLHTKLWIFASVIIGSAFALTHLVKYSIKTNKNFAYLLPWGSGPTMSTPIERMAMRRLWVSSFLLGHVGYS